MAVIKWARAATHNAANTYLGANGEVVVDMEQNRLFLYDGANAYVSNTFFSANTYVFSATPYQFQGDTYGFIMGGFWSPSPSALSELTNEVRKFTFSSQTSAVDGADIGSFNVNGGSPGQNAPSNSGKGHGYLERDGNFFELNMNSSTPATSLGFGLSPTAPFVSASSIFFNSDGDNLYATGLDTPADTNVDGVEKFAFASASATSDFGELLGSTDPGYGVQFHCTTNDSVGGFGYINGGRTSPSTFIDMIQRFPFSAGSYSGTDVAELLTPLYNSTGLSSPTHGYTYSGDTPSNPSTPQGIPNITKYPFASNVPASNIGNRFNIGLDRAHGGAMMSTEAGYMTTGFPTLAPFTTFEYDNDIVKINFVSDTNAADVGQFDKSRGTLAATSQI